MDSFTKYEVRITKCETRMAFDCELSTVHRELHCGLICPAVQRRRLVHVGGKESRCVESRKQINAEDAEKSNRHLKRDLRSLIGRRSRVVLRTLLYAPAADVRSCGCFAGASAIRATPITTSAATPIKNPRRSSGFWTAITVMAAP